jgi:hypothetical protein
MGNFYTDVIKKDPRFKSTKLVNDMALLEPVTRELVQAIIDDAAAGIKLMAFETYRSPARQAKLFAQGATKLKTVGVHHYGLACDLVKDFGGEPSWKGDFKFLGRLAKTHKLIWGGDWGKPGVKPRSYDGVHVQRCTVASAMAKADTGDEAHDALAWYGEIFAPGGMDNATAGADTLRHLFVLLIGLGMRESSGRYCEGRDRAAANTTAETAEAGLFQTSFNARTASPLLPTLFAQYAADPLGFVEIFKEGVRCSPRDLENFGDGPGMEFQRLSKSCPAFAAEFAAVGLRRFRKHWGPINRREAEVRPECDDMLVEVQAAVDAVPEV